MKITYIKLTNFVGVYAAMGLHEVEFDFTDIDKPIIQIYGKNRCGKTVLIQQLHPFSTINLNGDERADLSLIIPNKVGMKRIVYEVNGEVYDIVHTYQPTKNSHSVSSSIMHNGQELNPSGGVTTFNSLIEKTLGINKYVFQFIINGTQLTSFANMSSAQRKNLLNKALGIDIYDKIHKLAKDDYRYTNKMITSLNNTKEYILSQYGSYEALCIMLKKKQEELVQLSNDIDSTKNEMMRLNGEIGIITNQHPREELMKIESSLVAYKNVVDKIGSYDPDMYDKLVQEQISLNNKLSELKNQRLLLRKDIDVLYAKKNDIENTMMKNRRARDDYDNMCKVRDEIKSKLDSLVVETSVDGSPQYYESMIHTAQTINGMCTEIFSCLNKNHLEMFVEMIETDVDISAFLMREGSVLNDTEKEMSVVSRFKRMVEGVDGDFVDKECINDKCIYRRTYNMIQSFFQSYQSTTSNQFTEYDLEQMEHAYKNVQTMKRLLNTYLTNDLNPIFDLKNILTNILHNKIGIDVSYIRHLMEQSSIVSQRSTFIGQLSNIESSIEQIKKLIITDNDGNSNDMIAGIDENINSLKQQDNAITTEIDRISSLLTNNEQNKMLLYQVKNININELNKQKSTLSDLIRRLDFDTTRYSTLEQTYSSLSVQYNSLSNEIKVLNDAYNQYVSTNSEIEKNSNIYEKYRIIAEATSSTKGKPVITIRDTVEHALTLTNRLLNIMYDGEIELLEPTIDESSFSLPFRSGSHTSPDIKYGSQSENTLLSLALELSLVSSLTQYDVPLIDELDAYLDDVTHDSFLLMIQEMMATLKIEQLFLISHNIQPGQYDHIVHVVDISKK